MPKNPENNDKEPLDEETESMRKTSEVLRKMSEEVQENRHDLNAKELGFSREEYNTLRNLGGELYDALHSEDKVNTGKLFAVVSGTAAFFALNHLRKGQREKLGKKREDKK